MSNTITLPTPEKPKGQIFNLDDFKFMHGDNYYETEYWHYKEENPLCPHNDNQCYFQDQGDDGPKNLTINLPEDVVIALLDAANNPVCPACESALLFNTFSGDREGFMSCTNGRCMSGPTISFNILPKWLKASRAQMRSYDNPKTKQLFIALTAALRSPTAFRKWLESLKGDSDE